MVKKHTNKPILLKLSLFEVFILNQEIVWVADYNYNKVKKYWVIMHAERPLLNQTLRLRGEELVMSHRFCLGKAGASHFEGRKGHVF